MQLRNDEGRYGAVAQGFHWLIAALILATIVIALGVVCFCVGAYLRVSETSIITGWAVKGTGVSLVILGRVMWCKPQRLTRERRRR